MRDPRHGALVGFSSEMLTAFNGRTVGHGCWEHGSAELLIERAIGQTWLVQEEQVTRLSFEWGLPRRYGADGAMMTRRSVV